MMRRSALRLALCGLAGLSCQEPEGSTFLQQPLMATAFVTGIVLAPNGQPAVAQLVYVHSTFTATCSDAAPMVSFVRTNAAGAFRFDRVTAPNEGTDFCVTIRVIPETSTGYAESGRINGFVDFRLLPPLDTLSFEVTLASR